MVVGRPSIMSEPRVIVVTGGTKGLGRTIAEAFLAKGDFVWVLARHAPAGSSPNVLPRQRHIAVDVRSREQLDAAVVSIRAESGQIDVWINNAGFGKLVPFHDVDNALWEEMFAV